MELSDFIAQIPNFHEFTPREKIRLFAWHLHVHKGKEFFDNADVRDCFNKVHVRDPNVARDLPRLADSKPPDLIRIGGGYKLEGSLRRDIDAKYGVHQSVVIVTKLLSDLPTQVPDIAQRAFLTEALDCYRVRAYRAAIVMTWNLAFDHLLRWIMADQKRLADFSASISLKYPKKAAVNIVKIDDFAELKETEIIEICRTANLLAKNTVEILREKLKRRNIAAHPSQVIVMQSQADDAITDLVNNVVLVLA
jgi:hypothetical protein